MEQVEELVEKKTKPHTIHIFVEVSKTDHRKIEFDTNMVTGAQIKTKAGVDLGVDLGRRHEGNVDLVGNDQTVEIHNGEHFVVLPFGTIS